MREEEKGKEEETPGTGIHIVTLLLIFFKSYLSNNFNILIHKTEATILALV
jgi:hypothetical protein